MSLSSKAQSMEGSIIADLGTIERRLRDVFQGRVRGVDAKSWRLQRALDRLRDTKQAVTGCLLHSED